jgi:hypothetical protein
MTTFKERMAKAKAAKQTEDISFNIYKFEDEGDSIVGELLAAGRIKIKNPDPTKDDNEVIQYRILTDDGPVCVVLGVSGDKSIEDNKVKKGDVLEITYQGQKELDKGRRVNLFGIEVMRKE